MRLEPILDPGLCLILTGLTSKNAVIDGLSALANRRFPQISPSIFTAAFRERESKFPTGTPEGVAFPHALMPEIPQSAILAAILRPPVRWGGREPTPQGLVLGILGNSETPWEHVRLLARLARIVRGPGALDRLLSSPDGTALHAHLLAEDRSHG